VLEMELLDLTDLSPGLIALAPAALMLMAGLAPRLPSLNTARLWRIFRALSGLALVCTLFSSVLKGLMPSESLGLGLSAWLNPTILGSALALLVQFVGTVIGAFSGRYLSGEMGQRRYVAALAGVLTAVHLLLLANHWVVLIAAWALVGVALQHLLCFYPDRPFALLAAHKKRMADRLADVLLITAGALAWREVGSGSFAELWLHLNQAGMSFALHASAVCLVLAVVLRTALLPVHGWLIQVMEAPTPVSALLHAGVVNLGGYVLILFAPLLEQASVARWLLVGFGFATAVLAGLVMLTRISIKVRLAWSTVAQMGFMVLECGLGLYTLAALHLAGHSLYKAHAFLSASTVVRQTGLQVMRGPRLATPASLLLAPLIVVPTVMLIQGIFGAGAWPWWWSVVMGLAWAPLLWLVPRTEGAARGGVLQALVGLLMVAGLTGAALLAHAVPLGFADTPHHALGLVALVGMAMLYMSLVVLQLRPRALAGWRRWSYAGFYVDEFYTRLALRFWPARWTPDSSRTAH
jgi:NAD(P)H-quinone oxidoreductase subunit 5